MTTRADAQIAARRVHGPPREEESVTAYGGFVTRTIAFAIDAAVINLTGIVVAVVVTLVFSVIPASDDLKSAVVAAGAALYVAWTIAYFVTFWTTTGQTLGNRAMRIRVARVDGTPLRPRHGLVRLIGIVVAAVPLLAGFVPILITERRRGLHDFLAGTVVRARGE